VPLGRIDGEASEKKGVRKHGGIGIRSVNPLKKSRIVSRNSGESVKRRKIAIMKDRNKFVRVVGEPISSKGEKGRTERNLIAHQPGPNVRWLRRRWRKGKERYSMERPLGPCEKANSGCHWDQQNEPIATAGQRSRVKKTSCGSFFLPKRGF